MRWRLLFALIGLSITGVTSFAQRPPGADGLSSTRSSLQDAGFFDVSGVVRFDLIQGRLCLDAPRHRKGSQNCGEGGVYESITVTAERGIPSMHYVCQTSDHHLTLSVQNADSVRIESWFPQTSQRGILEQPGFGAITWTVRGDDSRDRYEATTLLHLRQQDTTSFDEHIGGLLKRLLQGRSMQSLCQQTQVATLSRIPGSSMPELASVLECVEQLGSPRRQIRAAAERQLLLWGTPIVTMLQSLSREDLDAEQAHRVQHVLGRLKSRRSDTPATLAMLLVNDPKYWSSIAAGLSADERTLATNHLKRLGLEADLGSHEPAQRIATK